MIFLFGNYLSIDNIPMNTYTAINIIVKYLWWQRIFRSVFRLAVCLHVRLFVFFTRLSNIHQIVRYILAVQYHGDSLLAFFHLRTGMTRYQSQINMKIKVALHWLTSLLPDMPDMYTFTTIFNVLMISFGNFEWYEKQRTVQTDTVRWNYGRLNSERLDNQPNTRADVWVWLSNQKFEAQRYQSEGEGIRSPQIVRMNHRVRIYYELWTHNNCSISVIWSNVYLS